MHYSTGLVGMSLIDYVVKSCNLSFVPTFRGCFLFLFAVLVDTMFVSDLFICF